MKRNKKKKFLSSPQTIKKQFFFLNSLGRRNWSLKIEQKKKRRILQEFRQELAISLETKKLFTRSANAVTKIKSINKKKKNATHSKIRIWKFHSAENSM